MDFRHRFQAKLSKAVELSGNEIPISKAVKSSQMHETRYPSFRSSAYSILSQPQNPYSTSITPSKQMYSEVQPQVMYPQMYLTPPPMFPTQAMGFPMPQGQFYPMLPGYYPQVSPTWQQLPMSQMPSPMQVYQPVQYPFQPQSQAFQTHSPSLYRQRVAFSTSKSEDIPSQLVASRSVKTIKPVSRKGKRQRGNHVERKSALPSFQSQLIEARKVANEKLPPIQKEVEIPFSKKRAVDFSPYTYDDYLKIKPDGYQKLGGLGPTNVNTKEWKDQTRRRIQASLYGKLARIKNLEAMPASIHSQTYDY